MKFFNTVRFLLVATIGFLYATPSHAGCWVVFQGIHSHVECDSAGIRPTFQNLHDAVAEYQGLSSDCKQSIMRTMGAHFSCAGAIFGAIKSGGATVWVGAGEACSEYSNEVQENQRVCRQYVDLRTKPASARVCNARAESINVAVARRTFADAKIASGWFPVAGGQCRDFAFPDARVIYAMAYVPNGSQIYPAFNTGLLDDNATFCIDRYNRFDNLDATLCHNRPDHNPYDMAKPGAFKFTQFGRVSGLPGGFTFR